MKRWSLPWVVALAPVLAGCGQHLSDQEKTAWVEYWTELCKCAAPGVDRPLCEVKLHRPEQKLPYAKYSAGDREIIQSGGIRCEGGIPR